jgi:hypothetical protein
VLSGSALKAPQALFQSSKSKVQISKMVSPAAMVKELNISREYQKSGYCRFFDSNFELCSLNFEIYKIFFSNVF